MRDESRFHLFFVLSLSHLGTLAHPLTFYSLIRYNMSNTKSFRSKGGDVKLPEASYFALKLGRPSTPDVDTPSDSRVSTPISGTDEGAQLLTPASKPRRFKLPVKAVPLSLRVRFSATCHN